MRNKIVLSVLSVSVFLVLIISLSASNILPVIGISGNTTYFNVTLTISNVAPVITAVPSGQTDTPVEGTTKIMQITFNASDSNGAGTIPASNAQVSLNQSGVRLTSSACSISSTSGTTNQYVCNITLNYYNLAGAWTINASIYDTSSSYIENTSISASVGTLVAISLKTTSLAFSGNPGDNDVSATNNPQQVNNTGNYAFTAINLTAFDLASGSGSIGAGNFTANTSNSAIGQTLANNTKVQLSNSALAVSTESSVGNRTIYLFLDIPSGVTNGTYSSVSSWVINPN